MSELASEPSTRLRIVSLVPSATETLLAWGIEPVAVTRFCEQPSLRHVGGTKDPDVAAIVALAPDLVVVNDDENRLEDHDALVAAGLEVHVLRIASVGDVEPELQALASRVGVEPPLIDLPPPRSPTITVFVPIWKRPWLTIGGYTSGSWVLAHIGATKLFADADDRFPATTLEEAAARHPDVVLAPSEPYPFAERHRAQLAAVAPVVLVDGQDLFWWGARTPAALRRLAGALDL